jgi:hypothetical protein
MVLRKLQYRFAPSAVSESPSPAYIHPHTHEEPMMDRFPTDPLALHRLHDQAIKDARALRREAIADFWRGADALVADAAAQALRSAERLAHRLRHHRQLRDGATG